MRWLAPEGGGDLRATFLEDGGTHDDDQPQGGEKGEGTESCNHRVDPSESANRTGPDLFQRGCACSVETSECSLFVLACQEARAGATQYLERMREFG
jgi:hypothetical protein